MPRLRPRFSLMSALLLTTIFGMGIVIVQLWREVGPLRDEVRRLRDEVGELSIDDPNKLHAIRVRTNEPLTWKWRIWVPPGEKVLARARWGNVSRNGTGEPVTNYPARLGPGEHWITYRVQHNAMEDSWLAILEDEGSGGGRPIPESERWWQRPYALHGGGVQYATVSAEQDEDVFVLDRFRVSDKQGTSQQLFNHDEPMSGYIVWLERQREK